MKNHYVSQFIIKRFSNAINIFNIQTGKIDESKRAEKIFYKRDAFDKEIEEILNFNIESRVANLLDRKICGKPQIVLTREEIHVLKCYMLINSIRSMCLDYVAFGKKIRAFLENANDYIAVFDEFKTLPDLTQVSISDEELFSRTLKVFASAKDLTDIANNPLATREMLGWAIPFFKSYIGFWDAPQNREFILTDNGMASEYEGFHQITGGIDISKISYLMDRIRKGEVGHGDVFATDTVMFENFDYFIINSKRMMVMINPFFRLYHNQQVIFEDKTEVLPVPDIWPAVIQDRGLFDIPENQYRFSPQFLDDQDLFIYNAKTLSEEDYIYLNELNLGYAQDVIGFNDPLCIIDTIYYHIWKNANYRSVKSLQDSEYAVACRLMEEVVKSPYHSLIAYCEHMNGRNVTDFIELFENLTDNIYKDFNENPYICEYYLENPDQTIDCKYLDFLGEGKKKIEFFKKHLEEITEARKKNDIQS